MKKEKKQSAYKPGSVPCLDKAPVIYLHLLSPISSSGLPSDVGRATLIMPVYMTLQLLRCTARHVTMRLVGSYPTFSPLPCASQGGYFLLHYSTFTDSFPLGSRMLYVARTFLFCSTTSATDRSTAFRDAKINIFIGTWKFHFVILYF